jgi:tetratricopeptide (TPR) repeat protein
MKKVMLKILIASASFLFFFNAASAQNDQLEQAHAYMDSSNYDKAIEIYQKLYEQLPDEVYGDFLDALLKAKDLKAAEKLATARLGEQPHNPVAMIDVGRVYEARGKDKKAEEQYTNALQMLNGEEMQTQQVAKAFEQMGKNQYVIQTYERAMAITGNPYEYGNALAKLYAQNGDIGKATDIMLDANHGQYVNVENAKTLLLEILGDDPAKLQQAQKALFKKINEHPDNNYYVELLTWLYTQKNDWDGALIQMEALDERNKEGGHRVLDFANNAARAGQYETALKGYNDVLDQNPDKAIYNLVLYNKLKVAFLQLKDRFDYTPQEVDSLQQQFATAADQHLSIPLVYKVDMATDYATLEAQYANDPQKAVAILQDLLTQPDLQRDQIGMIKLQLGDYYVLTGAVWDASLTYSQVDKEFKEDALGEEARFRNAKLAYYRGDFTWAQRQLSVLKASTSELIANDALYLSVLITENVPDSNYYPLQRFAYADLLLFQNKDKEASALLDSISTAFPQHPLNDDILMLRAKIAEKHRDYTQALAYLKQVYEQYGKDVLGDDAVFKTAEIYEKYLKQNDQAQHFYEQLIIDYPGSTYVQTARQRLQELKKPNLP